MVDTNRLKGELAAHEITQTQMAKNLRMTPKTFSSRMKNKRFYTDEIDIMVEILNLDKEKAIQIFFV